jgi:hypothetical protein
MFAGLPGDLQERCSFSFGFCQLLSSLLHAFFLFTHAVLCFPLVDSCHLLGKMGYWQVFVFRFFVVVVVVVFSLYPSKSFEKDDCLSCFCVYP